MERGFSLTEVMLAVLVTAIVSSAVFHLFERNEHLYRDQNLVSEMQQSARAAVSQISDEIRMAGQGTPRYAASFGSADSEATVAILSGSNATRLNLRAGLSPAESSVTSPVPLTLTAAVPVTLTADSVTGFYNAIGGSPSGRFLYIWGDSGNERWQWVRAAITSVSQGARSLQISPVEFSPGGSTFAVAPTVSLEEALAIYRDSTTATLKHTTATNMSNPVSPSWAPANDLATNVTQLKFDYFDESGMPIVPDSLAHRSAVAQIEVLLVVDSGQALSNGSVASATLTMRTWIRGKTIH